MKKLLTVGLLLASLYVMAQIPREQQAFGATMPATTFQSTGSSMMSTGSAYSSNPVLSSDGTATMNGASYSPAHRPGGGPRRAGAFDDPDEDMPIGDALIPLLLMVMAYAISILLRRRKSRA